MSKRGVPKHVVVPVTPEVAERINALAKADRRSRTSWLTVQLERLVAQGPQELPEERSAA
jgi:hypothetical protein